MEEDMSKRSHDRRIWESSRTDGQSHRKAAPQEAALPTGSMTSQTQCVCPVKVQISRSIMRFES